jgi:hypothetical protein
LYLGARTTTGKQRSFPEMTSAGGLTDLCSMDHHAVAAGPFGKVECRIGLSLHVLCGHEFTVFHQYR